MDVRSLLVTTGSPDLVTSPARIDQIAETALAVSGWQLGVCLCLVGCSIGRKELTSGKVGSCTACRSPVLHMLKSKLSSLTVTEVVRVVLGSLV